MLAESHSGPLFTWIPSNDISILGQDKTRQDKTRQDNVLFGVLYSPMYIDFGINLAKGGGGANNHKVNY